MNNAILWGMVVLFALPIAMGAQLTQLSVHAPSIQAGEPLTLTYTLVDTNELGRVTTDVYLSQSINHQTVQTVRSNTYKHSQTFILPRDHQAGDEILVRINAPHISPITRSITLHPRQATQPMPTAETGVYVLVDPVRDVVQGDAVYYRVRVVNTQNRAQQVTVGLSDVGSWATYRVDPSPTALIGPQETYEAYIYLKVDSNARPGITYFDVTAQHNNFYEAETIKIAVLQPMPQKTLIQQVMPWIVLAAIILLAALLITAVINKRSKKGKGGDDDEFITYY
ncbi:MAG: hypothetical protein ACMXYD_03790 [Candidatus Woesearchaeota archaeon]